MLEHRDSFTLKDIEYLKVIIEQSEAFYADSIHVALKDLSQFAKSHIAITSRLFYYYLMHDCLDLKSKEDKFNSLNLDDIVKNIVDVASRAITERGNLYKSAADLNDELFYSIESSLLLHLDIIKPYSLLNPNQSLMADLFVKFFRQALGLLRMLNLELSSEAYSIWRTLHEAECVIKLLVEGGSLLQQVYLRHLVYISAFRKGISSKEETDKIFEELKGNMAKHGLKSKDMKKYIEYGWLYACKTYNEADPLYKLNFRDGLERSAKLGEYSQYYEMASEFAHSSPIFFYSNDEFLSDLTTCQLSDIVLRGFEYFEKYCEISHISYEDKKLKREVLIANLKAQAKQKDNTFYTKYKDYLIEDEED